MNNFLNQLLNGAQTTTGGYTTSPLFNMGLRLMSTPSNGLQGLAAGLQDASQSMQQNDVARQEFQKKTLDDNLFKQVFTAEVPTQDAIKNYMQQGGNVESAMKVVQAANISLPTGTTQNLFTGEQTYRDSAGSAEHQGLVEEAKQSARYKYDKAKAQFDADIAKGVAAQAQKDALERLGVAADINRSDADYYATQGYDPNGKPIEMPAGSVDINGNPIGSGDSADAGKGTVKVYDKATGMPRYVTKSEATILTTPDGQYVAEQPEHIKAGYEADSTALRGMYKVDEKTGKSTDQMIREAGMRGKQLADLNAKLGEKNVIDQAQAYIGSATGTDVEPDYNAWTQATAADFALSMIPGMGALSNMESERLQLTVPSAKDPKVIRDRYVNSVQAKAAIASYGKELMTKYLNQGMPVSGNQAYEEELNKGAEAIIKAYKL